MESNLNKYIAVAYKLYTVDGEVSELVEEATDGEPFQFISGYGIALDAFEQKVAALEKDVMAMLAMLLIRVPTAHPAMKTEP